MGWVSLIKLPFWYSTGGIVKLELGLAGMSSWASISCNGKSAWMKTSEEDQSTTNYVIGPKTTWTQYRNLENKPIMVCVVFSWTCLAAVLGDFWSAAPLKGPAPGHVRLSFIRWLGFGQLEFLLIGTAQGGYLCRGSVGLLSFALDCQVCPVGVDWMHILDGP